MPYLLDTKIVSDLVRKPHGRVVERIHKVGQIQVCTSINLSRPSCVTGQRSKVRRGSLLKSSPCWAHSKSCLLKRQSMQVMARVTLASMLPARRATAVNPLEVLRSEYGT
jgi:hypothetical protein